MPQVMNLLPRRGRFPSAESIFWLLLTGDVPTEAQTMSLIADWSRRRQKRSSWLTDSQTILRALPTRLGPLKKFTILLSALENTDKHVRKGLKSRAMKHEHWEVRL